MAASFDLNNWNACLQAVTPQDNVSPHKYLCHVRGADGTRNIQALSQNEMNAYKVPFWKIWVPNPCQKLSFDEICHITLMATSTKFIFGKLFTVPNKRIIFSKIENFVQIQLQLENADSKDKLQEFLSSVGAFASVSKDSIDCLSKMAARSSFQHQQKRMQSIWGKINYYIWSWFSDKSTAIQQLNTERVQPGDIKQKFIEEFRYRIWLNIDELYSTNDMNTMYDNSGVVEGSNYHRVKDENDIESPRHVKQLLLPYHSDKCGEVFYKKIEENHIRATQLNKVWENVEELFADMSSSGDSSSFSSQPLTLEG